jgi:uncharacterized protein (TIGR02246 family)
MSKPAPTDGSAATPAILNLLERLNQGFVQRDVTQVLGLFTPDPETVFIGSEADEIATGPTQLRRLLQGLFARPETYHWRWGHAQVGATGRVAWLTTEAVLLVEGPQPLELPYRMTLVLQRRENAWLIMHYHGSEPAEAPQPSPTANTDLSQQL